MKTNREWLQEIKNLMDANPDLDVKVFVDSYTLSEHALTDQSIIDVKIKPRHLFEIGDGLILTEKDEIIDRFIDEGMTADEAAVKFDAEVPQVILIYTGA